MNLDNRPTDLSRALALCLCIGSLLIGCTSQPASDELLERAEQIVQSGESANLPTATDLADRALLRDPHHHRALFLAGVTRSAWATTEFKVHGSSRAAVLTLDAAAAFRRLRDVITLVRLSSEERSQMGWAFYNAACIHSLNGRFVEAVSALDEAYAVAFSGRGTSWRELSDQAAIDSDLERLRPLPVFTAFQARLRHQALAAVRDETPPDRPEIERRDLLSGLPVSLKSQRGRVVALLYWGSWCPPSSQLRKALADLTRDGSNGNLVVIGVECEFAPADQVGRLAREAISSDPSPFPNILADQALLDRLPSVTTFPTLLLLDRDGFVRLRLTGQTAADTIAEAVRMVDEPSAESRPVGPGTSG